MRQPVLHGLIVFVAAAAGAFGQRLSLGFIGGANLTHDFSTSYQIDPSEITTFVLFSDSHSLIVGPAMEVDLRKALSVEVDALHRNLQLERGFITPGGQRVAESDPGEIGTWEFPFLLKYKIPVSKMRPFVELGPSFRVRKNPNSTKPSANGFSAGLGAEFRLGRFRLSPTIRYTRWAGEPPFPQAVANTKPDQSRTSNRHQLRHVARVMAYIRRQVPCRTGCWRGLSEGVGAGAARRTAAFRIAKLCRGSNDGVGSHAATLARSRWSIPADSGAISE